MYHGCIVDGPYILPSEIIRQRRTNIVCSYLFVELKKKPTDTENRLLVARGGVWVVGKMDEGSEEVKTSIHNKN